ncbi:hypothetical protein OG897_40045 [Streptomyces sp. NBC_00237]|uniref:hypothetical protein n=1 Tax=Streptomyces sp. NBC_00237 TaxID=2975687 RepID=UPI002256BD5B|nr:hypothetical protein [Streptomyces sp. NBC_00237]MCX5207584.1 hypothetical protein [Streptomyces sp. NBC_00237]
MPPTVLAASVPTSYDPADYDHYEDLAAAAHPAFAAAHQSGQVITAVAAQGVTVSTHEAVRVHAAQWAQHLSLA